jgi:hypothetical protein
MIHIASTTFCHSAMERSLISRRKRWDEAAVAPQAVIPGSVQVAACPDVGDGVGFTVGVGVGEGEVDDDDVLTGVGAGEGEGEDVLTVHDAEAPQQFLAVTASPEKPFVPHMV